MFEYKVILFNDFREFQFFFPTCFEAQHSRRGWYSWCIL